MLFILGVLVALIALVAFGKLARASRGDSFPVVGASRAGAGIVALVAALVAVSQVLTVIPAGHVGVVDFFGTVSPVTLKAGINFVNPLARIVKFSVKTQEIKETMDVPSKEGLTVQLEISALFHLDPDKAAEVYKSDRARLRRDHPRAAVPLGRARRHGRLRRQGALHLRARDAGADDHSEGPAEARRAARHHGRGHAAAPRGAAGAA